MINRRRFLKYAAGLSCLSISSPGQGAEVITRPIPSTGEQLPVIGMGTWGTFNVGNNANIRAARCQVLDVFFQMGGTIVDSSPMYGSSEEVIGHCVENLQAADQLFSATKVWTSAMDDGRAQIQDSHNLWRIPQFGLFQVHNLVAWQTHLPYLQQLKSDGKIRYVGISTSHGRRHRELKRIMETEDIDFIQLTYNIQDREAERHLLPMAIERDIAVIANRPFRRAALFDHLHGRRLPAWAEDFDCQNLAQFLLKFIVSHPAITCAIPATSQVAHMTENMGAQLGRLPDATARRRMIQWFENS